ncbi:hypothetical protein N7454_008172 [Penicillium verhagenii]|nr:hypothetical protein N7454_008172 [Penicillium verhagenii]
MPESSNCIPLGVEPPQHKKPAAIAADILVSLAPDNNGGTEKRGPGSNAETKASYSNYGQCKARRSRRGRARRYRGRGGGNKTKPPVSSEAGAPVVADRPRANTSAADPPPYIKASAPPGDKGEIRRAPLPSANSGAIRTENVDDTPNSPPLPATQPVTANESSEGWLIEFSDSE